jgi:hypothetical protein
MIDTAPALLEPWPLQTDAPWRVLAWPDWRAGGDLAFILGTLGPALAEVHACLCLRHDAEMDGPLDAAKARLKKVAAERLPNGRDLDILFVDGPLSDADWERLGASVHAKVSKAHSTNQPRRQRIDQVRAFELRTAGDVARLLTDDPEITRLDQFRRSFADVPGWFQMPAICIWDSLLTLQSRSKVRGNLLEIGVWMGRSALLSTLHSSKDEECVFVDPLPTREARANLETIRDSGLHFVDDSSRNLVPEMLPGSVPPSYRWIHIDGEHTGVAVAHDLALASRLLGERGIIVIDDFFAPAYPQITFAAIDYLHANPKSLMMFLCGFNKGYLCHPSDGRWMLDYVARELSDDLIARGSPPFTLFKTTDPLDLNCFGIDQRRTEYAFRGPDNDPDLLRY